MFSRLVQCSTRQQSLWKVATVQRSFSQAAATTPTGAPSVRDLLVELNIVDPSGARKKIKGIIGKTLYDACERQGIRLGPDSVGGAWEIKRSETWVEPTFGEGANGGFDHVVLHGNGVDTLHPPNRTELYALNDHWDFDDLYDNSRLASCVVVSKEMDGMTVYVPERLDYHIP